MHKYIFMRFPGGKPKAFTLSYDDCVEQDVPFIEMCDKYGLKATFNVNAGLWAPEGTVFPKGQVHRHVTKSIIFRNSGLLSVFADNARSIYVPMISMPFFSAKALFSRS